MPIVPTSKPNFYSLGSSIETACDVFEYASRTRRTGKALKWREVVEVHGRKEKVTENIRGKEIHKLYRTRGNGIESRKGTGRTRVSEGQVFSISYRHPPTGNSSYMRVSPSSPPFPKRTIPLAESSLTGRYWSLTNAELSTTLHRVLLDHAFSQGMTRGYRWMCVGEELSAIISDFSCDRSHFVSVLSTFYSLPSVHQVYSVLCRAKDSKSRQPLVTFYTAHVFEFLTLNPDSLLTIPAVPSSKTNLYNSISMEITSNPTPGEFPTRWCALSSSQLNEKCVGVEKYVHILDEENEVTKYVAG
ncbi:hypothetical protein GYMLUDRAFT_251385 [Collybiopsis luxurians FD-317 M1]|uniref:Unplaced genomic scaffold GYMLUscaffold_98, whole genome shotgun sequence n=1 Tax=Collybiopsis luxurians FD-317 M1 TaxID=944289 RepID=A0A0D0CBI8_9AGAR|nr:hypothetical protein GYMLUDRAFT_251385 [Collybiopsis luxurians FD-317 M1]